MVLAADRTPFRDALEDLQRTKDLAPPRRRPGHPPMRHYAEARENLLVMHVEPDDATFWLRAIGISDWSTLR